MKFRWSLILSTAIHLLLVAALLVTVDEMSNPRLEKPKNSGDQDEGQSRKGFDAKNIIEKQRPTEVTIIDPLEDDMVIKGIQKVDVNKECPGKWYGGIGIQEDIRSSKEVIEIVFKGYPADIAGLEAGDEIVWVSSRQIIGDPGTSIDMIVLRGSRTIRFHLTRGKVCY
jgi:C-terminal processing protease CtpA/Prc